MAFLGYSWADADVVAGVPAGHLSVVDIPAGEKLRLLRREIEPLAFPEMKRMATGDFRSGEAPIAIPKTTGTDLVDDIAALFDSPRNNPRISTGPVSCSDRGRRVILRGRYLPCPYRRPTKS